MSTWRDRGPALSHEARPGGVTIGRIFGAPIRVFPLGIVLVALMLGGLRFAPGVWIGLLLLVLVHELGHALMVRYFRKKVVDIEVNGLGGLCRWSGEATPTQRASIAWGGVLAQALLYGATSLTLHFVGPPTGVYARELVQVFTVSNLWIGLVNLIPIPPLDGAEAWRLPMLLQRRYQGYLRRTAVIAEVVEERRRASDAPPPKPPATPSMVPYELDDAEIPESLRTEVKQLLDKIVRDTVKEKE